MFFFQKVNALFISLENPLSCEMNKKFKTV